MEHILQSLEQNVILSDEIVIDLQQNIRRNYPSADSRYRARLLAQSLHEKLDEYLQGLSEEYRSGVRVSIFKNSIESSHLNISQMDLVHEVLKTNMHDDDIVMYMANWFNQYTDLALSFDEIHGLLNSINPQYEDLLARTDNFISGNQVREFPENFTNAISSKIYNIKSLLNNKYYKLIIIILSSILALPSIYATDFFNNSDNTLHKISFIHASDVLLYKPTLNSALDQIVKDIYAQDDGGYPDFLKYSDTVQSNIVNYLHSRNSSFTNDSYLKIIYKVAEEYDVHPLLLLAIIGQEQGFVPKDSPYATRILNNPFNVYTSWTNYNTNLQDSCEVAAGTIRNILRERPKGENPFKWLNTRYAEDPNWWKGVQELFYTLLAHSE